MAYIKGNSVPHANLGVLDRLIAARHELAQVPLNGLNILHLYFVQRHLIR